MIRTGGPGPGPSIHELRSRFELIYREMNGDESRVQAETDGVVDLKSRAESEAPPELGDEVSLLVATAEEVDRTGNTSLYDQPDVRQAFERVQAKAG